jgi:uncharacterized membrane protein
VTVAREDKNAVGKAASFAGSRAGAIIYSIAAVIALVGLADATYLTVAHLTGDDSVCGSFAGCSAVLGSVYATTAGIPTAAFGAVGYFLVFSAAVLVAFGNRRARSFLVLVVASMFIATLWLLYLQAFVLHAFCPFCLLSAALIFLLSGLLLATPSSR